MHYFQNMYHNQGIQQLSNLKWVFSPVTGLILIGFSWKKKKKTYFILRILHLSTKILGHQILVFPKYQGSKPLLAEWREPLIMLVFTATNCTVTLTWNIKQLKSKMSCTITRKVDTNPAIEKWNCQKYNNKFNSVPCYRPSLSLRLNREEELKSWKCSIPSLSHPISRSQDTTASRSTFYMSKESTCLKNIHVIEWKL